jgi:hypothetical protein
VRTSYRDMNGNGVFFSHAARVIVPTELALEFVGTDGKVLWSAR